MLHDGENRRMVVHGHGAVGQQRQGVVHHHQRQVQTLEMLHIRIFQLSPQQNGPQHRGLCQQLAQIDVAEITEGVDQAATSQ